MCWEYLHEWQLIVISQKKIELMKWYKGNFHYSSVGIQIIPHFYIFPRIYLNFSTKIPDKKIMSSDCVHD